MSAMKIGDWRAKIDAIDTTLLHLLNVRAGFALEVGRLKGESGQPLRVPAREREILELVLCGESSKCIASALEISPKTVEAHRAHITKKLNVRSFNEIMGKIFGKMISDALHAIQ